MKKMNEMEEMLNQFKYKMEGKIPMNLDVDDDLKALENELGIKGEKDALDDLDDLENEINTKVVSNKKEKSNVKVKNTNIKDLDDNLKELEDEGLDDISISDDDEKPNLDNKLEIKKSLINSLLENSVRLTKKKEDEEKKNVKKDEVEKEDIYFENTEKKYHDINQMKCLSVLDNEMKVCDSIIQFKKDNKIENEDVWESKKFLAKTNFNRMNTFVENGAISIEDYKKLIEEEKKIAQNLLNNISKDKNLKSIEIPEIKNRINKRIELIDYELKQLKDQLGDEEEDDNDLTGPKDKKLDDNLLKRVKNKIKEYSKAVEYFTKNDLEEQLNVAKNNIKKLENAQKKIEALYSNKVKEDSLPEEITPEFIYGYSKEDRMRKFKEILKEMLSQKNNINKEITQINVKMSNLKASELENVESKFKEEIKIKKDKINKYEKLIEIIKQIIKDKWTPAPLYSKGMKIDKIETFNELVEKNVLNIFIGKIVDFKNDKSLFLDIYLDIGKGFSDIIDINKNNNFNYNVDWIIEKEFKEIYKYKLGIKLCQKGEKKPKVIGHCLLDLGDLKSKYIIQGKYPIELVKPTKIIPKLEIKISTRIPCVDPIYKENKIPIYVINKIYPSYKGQTIKIDFDLQFDSTGVSFSQEKKQTNTNISSEKKIDNPQNKNIGNTKIQNTNKDNNHNNQNNDNKKNSGNKDNQDKKPSNKIDGSKFKKEELLDPDIIDNLNSMEVLKSKKQFYEEKAKKIEGRTPKDLREKINKITVKVNQLQNLLGDKIQPADYLNIIKNQFIHDKELYQYFIQENQKEKADLVKPRINILMKEIQELYKFITGSGK